MSARALELDDIQGNVLGGFNTDVQTMLGLTVAQPQRFRDAAQWLASQADSVTVVSEVRASRPQMKSALPESGTWLFVAIGQRLIMATQPDVLIRDDAFNGGMLRRAPSILGDKTDPSTWRVGGPEAPLDVFLVVAANDEKAVAERAEALSSSAASAGLVTKYRETARRLDDREHFGFRDGISQPRVIGDDPDGNVEPGCFVFGYPRETGSPPFSPVIDPRGLTDNGSLLVFRRLVQDVSAFRQFCKSESVRIGQQWPGLTPDHLAALVVGRWPSGAPVNAAHTDDPGGSPQDNEFDFRDDLEARSCPFGAHIRKVNPRMGPRDVLEVPRILRRGIPFGPLFDTAPDEVDRGLAFLAFQTSVRGQFEFLTQHWMNSALNPARGNDLLVGRSDGTCTLQVAGPDGPIDVHAPVMRSIVPTGGAYLFVPSRSGLVKFGTPSAPIGLGKVRKIWAIASDTVRASIFE